MDEAKKAIMEVYNDCSIDPSVTRERMEELIEFIEENITALG